MNSPWLVSFLVGLLLLPFEAEDVSRPTAPWPATEIALLGSQVFHDRRLSSDGHVACVTCHQPERWFADSRPVSTGATGQRGTRNAPSLLGAGARGELFWDGRVKRLEEQVLQPFTNPREHGLADVAELENRVWEDPGYRRFLKERGVQSATGASVWIARALAEYVRSLPPATGKVDRFLAGSDAALDGSERRGLAVFEGRAGCAECHVPGVGTGFSDGKFHRTSAGEHLRLGELDAILTRVEAVSSDELGSLIAADPEVAALGRYLVTGDPKDIGKFRTPGLRNVADTAPYMHDGHLATLEEAVETELYYRRLHKPGAALLSKQERLDLMAFLRALSSDDPDQGKRAARMQGSDGDETCGIDGNEATRERSRLPSAEPRWSARVISQQEASLRFQEETELCGATHAPLLPQPRRPERPRSIPRGSGPR